MNKSLLPALFLLVSHVAAAIPAAPLMTLYQFNGALDVPYYDAAAFQRSGATTPSGTLAQGTSLVPCLVIRNGKPLADSSGTPYVGFEVVVNSRTATPSSTERFKQVLAQRAGLKVANHHCSPGVRQVIDVRRLYAMEKAPFFDAPVSVPQQAHASPLGELDGIVRAFHNSPDCWNANRTLTGRRASLEHAWNSFAAGHRRDWPPVQIEKAKHLDYVMRTAIFEGHLGRGCNAYGSCERNIIALSIRNRARDGGCAASRGCSDEGDFQGASSKVSQYNIWDELLTQTSGLTACFLKNGSSSGPRGEYYAKLQAIYEQNLPDIQRILFGDDRDLTEIFAGVPLSELKSLRHYYHAPAMGKCFPDHDRVEYITGAVARNGNNFALLANTRIRVDEKTDGGYRFRSFQVEAKEDRDVVQVVDSYPGFVVDARKVSLKGPSQCPPYGIPRGCRFETVGRYRTTPSWLSAGRPLELSCRIRDRGASCQEPAHLVTSQVGGACDTQMRPVAGIR